jgi:molybdopterin-guanine dinucleotide biosynthesis protein A
VIRSSLPAASGILLAGGRSSRFDGDKLATQYRGRPLIDHALGALAEVTIEVLLLVPPIGDPPLSAAVLADTRARIVRDPEPFGGPLVALLAGLERAAESLALVAGADMPSLAPAVMAAMLRALDASQDDLVVLDFRGHGQPLPIALRVGSATQRVSRLVGSGERSLRALLVGPGVAHLAEVDWRPLDPAADTLRDIDTRADLGRG